MEKFKIYLSGGMSGLTRYEQTYWRNQLVDKLKEMNEYGNYNKSLCFFNPPAYYSPSCNYHKSEREVFEYEIEQLKNSNLVVANFIAPQSIGTAMEIILAKELKIPVIGINENDYELHPWLTECCRRICETTNEAAQHINDYYLN